MSQSCWSVFFHRNILSLSCAALVVLSTPVMAQSPMGSIPTFVPASGWQIQKTPLSQVRGLEKMNLPCMMAASFDNGYIVRFSGNQGKMLAMAIDFRQNVFSQGRKYPASISVDGAYNKNVAGTAFSNSTLIFNLRELGGFYAAILSAKNLQLDVQDNPMSFNLGGMSGALQQLESCAAGNKFDKKTTQPASLPADKNGNTWQKPQASVSHMARAPQASGAGQKAKAQIWEAKAGDDMRLILEGWAKRADVKLDWQATNAGKVADDVRVQGTFEEAVQALMARNSAALGLDANMMGAPLSAQQAVANSSANSSASPQSLRPSVSMPVSTGNNSITPMPNAGRRGGEPTPLITPSASSSQSVMAGTAVMGGGGQWNAPAGASLQQILKTWSKQAGVEFIWDSNQGFSVIRPVKLGGSYEEALQALLNQYSTLKVRPAANLNNDPVTGRKTLFVQSSRIL